MSFNVIETTIEQVHAAYKSGALTCRQLVQTYLDRIQTYDKSGPALNAIITINSQALQEADRRHGIQSRWLGRPAARHSDHHERPGRRRWDADNARLGAVQRLLSRP
jgi:Asp-tRNA(Asn)/Glu-tRNA(Gln) amidotransferase A subunit family amidase